MEPSLLRNTCARRIHITSHMPSAHGAHRHGRHGVCRHAALHGARDAQNLSARILSHLFRFSVVTAECRLLPSLACPRCSVSCACTELHLCSYGAKADVWALGCVLCVAFVSCCVGRSALLRRFDRFVLFCAFRCLACRRPLSSDRIGAVRGSQLAHRKPHAGP